MESNPSNSMQQRLFHLEQLATQQQAQPSAEPNSSPEHTMDMGENNSVLHSLGIRPSYSWCSSPFLNEVLSLDTSLFPSTVMSEDERRKMIEKYPNIEGVQYQPPDTIPLASKRMNRSQSKEDMSLKRL
ncbi:hypothetical protein BDB01DRAFT_380531 [Pilobolus umbonatus]|nr:hypothetical protein BDB01DRAFT_380531 [Pilobolus umbonatus]